MRRTVTFPSATICHFPTLLFSTLQLLPSFSSADTVTTSSHSRLLDVDQLKLVTTGSFKLLGLTSNLVAFSAIDPWESS